MKKTTSFLIIAILGLVLSATAQSSPDPGNPDRIVMDSIDALPGQSFVMNVSLQADKGSEKETNAKSGVGSFCIPLKYDAKGLKVDSVKFVGIIAQWDEKFANSKIDTGFVSFAGIHNIAGAENPPFLSPDKPLESIRIYGSVRENAKEGVYLFELTIDPIQKDTYFGSTDGVNGWKPHFVPGKVVVGKIVKKLE